MSYSAVEAAMNECQQELSEESKSCILDLVKLTFRTSVVQFEGHWYSVPTGEVHVSK